MNMRDGEAENAATFEFKLQRHSGGLWPGQATPLLYRNLAEASASDRERALDFTYAIFTPNLLV